MAGTGFSLFTIQIVPDQPLANVTVRLDYGPAPALGPIYIGIAGLGSSDTDAASTAWTIRQFTYDPTGNLIAIRTAHDVAWANRVKATYA
jgi:YD repeat-containing protein